jgi:hypothetical protein
MLTCCPSKGGVRLAWLGCCVPSRSKSKHSTTNERAKRVNSAASRGCRCDRRLRRPLRSQARASDRDLRSRRHPEARCFIACNCRLARAGTSRRRRSIALSGVHIARAQPTLEPVLLALRVFGRSFDPHGFETLSMPAFLDQGCAPPPTRRHSPSGDAFSAPRRLRQALAEPSYRRGTGQWLGVLR